MDGRAPALACLMVVMSDLSFAGGGAEAVGGRPVVVAGAAGFGAELSSSSLSEPVSYSDPLSLPLSCCLSTALGAAAGTFFTGVSSSSLSLPTGPSGTSQTWHRGWVQLALNTNSMHMRPPASPVLDGRAGLDWCLVLRLRL
jgi:hypothetical protein